MRDGTHRRPPVPLRYVRTPAPRVTYQDILLRLPVPLLEALDQALGDTQPVTRSDLVRQAIEAFVARDRLKHLPAEGQLSPVVLSRSRWSLILPTTNGKLRSAHTVADWK